VPLVRHSVQPGINRLVIIAEADTLRFVIPAQAGIHFWAAFNMDSRFRGNDELSAETTTVAWDTT
jgi:hypothetical protein